MTEVLILEDEAIVAIDMAMWLEEQGYRVRGPFESGEKALESIARSTPDVAILDVNVQGEQDGLAVAERLKSQQVPFVIVTGYSATGYFENTDFLDGPILSKPYSQTELLKVLKSLNPV